MRVFLCKRSLVSNPEAAGTGFELTRKMISWPINGVSTQKEMIYKTIFEALLMLPQELNFHVAFLVDSINHCLQPYTYETIGAISFRKKILTTFKTKTGGKYDTMLDWPEIPQRELCEWTTENWVQFFKNRIMEKVVNDLREAEENADGAARTLEQQQEITRKVLDIFEQV